MSEKNKDHKLRVIDGGYVEPSGDYIQDVFGPKGYLAKLVEGYRPRPGQIDLARTIDRAMVTGRHVVSEGPTGTGKSLAYCVPAAFGVVNNKMKVCIVTSNKTLQAQIEKKDLTELREATGWDFKFAIRKGHASYLCMRDVERGDDTGWEKFTGDDLAMVRKVRTWARSTLTGDYEDGPGPSKKIWRAFSTTSDECAGPKCLQIGKCFVAKAKARARSVDIIITNYHLLYRHLTFEYRLMRASMKELGNQFDLQIHIKKRRVESNGILPFFDMIILDEAHNAVDIARDHLGDDATVKYNSIYRCLHGLHGVDISRYKKDAEELRAIGMRELGALWDYLDKRHAHELFVFEKPNECDSEALEETLTAVAGIYEAYSKAIEPSLSDEQRRLLILGKPANLTVRQAEDLLESNRTKALAGRSRSVAERLSNFRKMEIAGLVYFIEKEGADDHRPQIELKAKALYVGKYMREALFDMCPTVVQTSATLAIKSKGKSDFDHVKNEMGMSDLPDVLEISVPSPFNWHQQALLVVPETMPMYPSGKDENRAGMQEAYEVSALAHIQRIIETVRGRTLCLFTSHKMLRRAAIYLREKIPYRVLVQGEASNRELQDEFRKDIHSVLLGTESFGEGIDIQGESLSCVILDKLSHVPPSDPVLIGLEIRNAKYKREGKSEYDIFNRYRMPHAVMKFKQKNGRLIRTITDVGIMVCLDRRVLTASYSRILIGSLPPIRIAKSLDEIGPFLRSVGAL